jgi:hypothetical protein
LPDDLANAEVRHSVPGTNDVAFPALIAELEGLATGLLDLLDDFCERADCLHDAHKSDQAI